MPFTLDFNAPAQYIENPYSDTEHPRQINVSYGRPNFGSMLSIRELIHWTAYRFDASVDDEEVNHRLAVILRAIADEFYPPLSDEAECMIEEFVEEGCVDNFEFDYNPIVPKVDARLLNLVDGLASYRRTFEGVLWGNQETDPALKRNAYNHLDILFPAGAWEVYGVRGLRVHSVELIQFVRSHVELSEMRYQDEDAWLDALHLSFKRRNVNKDYRNDVKYRALYGAERVDEDNTLFAPQTEEQQAQSDRDAASILEELAGLV